MSSVPNITGLAITQFAFIVAMARAREGVPSQANITLIELQDVVMQDSNEDSHDIQEREADCAASKESLVLIFSW